MFKYYGSLCCGDNDNNYDLFIHQYIGWWLRCGDNDNNYDLLKLK